LLRETVYSFSNEKGSDELSASEMKEGSLILLKKLKPLHPKIICFNGMGVFETCLSTKEKVAIDRVFTDRYYRCNAALSYSGFLIVFDWVTEGRNYRGYRIECKGVCDTFIKFQSLSIYKARQTDSLY